MARVFVLMQWVISIYIGSGYPVVLWGFYFRRMCAQFSCCVRCVIRLLSYC